MMDEGWLYRRKLRLIGITEDDLRCVTVILKGGDLNSSLISRYGNGFVVFATPYKLRLRPDHQLIGLPPLRSGDPEGGVDLNSSLISRYAGNAFVVFRYDFQAALETSRKQQSLPCSAR